MSVIELVCALNLQPTPDQMDAMLELERRGLTFCSHFGYENCQELLDEMNEAFNGSELYVWMKTRLGIRPPEK